MPCFFTGAALKSTFFASIQNDVFLNSFSRLKHPTILWSPALKFVHSIRKLHPLGHPEKMNPSERSTTHHFQIGSHFDFDSLVILKKQTVVAGRIRTMPSTPGIKNIPNESWVWKLYLWLKKQLFWDILGIYSSKVPGCNWHFFTDPQLFPSLEDL